MSFQNTKICNDFFGLEMPCPPSLQKIDPFENDSYLYVKTVACQKLCIFLNLESLLLVWPELSLEIVYRFSKSYKIGILRAEKHAIGRFVFIDPTKAAG